MEPLASVVLRSVYGLAIVLFVSAVTSSSAWAETRLALVFGNGSYSNLSPLKNPVNDAKLMRQSLETAGFEVDLLLDGDRRAMGFAIARFEQRLAAAGRNAVGLFYYAGHGVQAGGRNYLIPVGAPIDSEAMLRFEAVEANEVLRSMERAGNRLNIVVLDACRDNPFRRHRSATRSFRSVSRGLARVDAPRGSLIAYSAAPGQVAVDGEYGNSPYTAALARAMARPGLKAEEVFKQVRIEVERATEARQTPWEESSLTGDFYFRPSAETSQPFDERAADFAFWGAIEDSDNASDFQAYIAQFPDGMFLVPARSRLQALQEATLLEEPQNQGSEVSQPQEPGEVIKPKSAGEEIEARRPVELYDDQETPGNAYKPQGSGEVSEELQQPQGAQVRLCEQSQQHMHLKEGECY